MEYNKNGYRGLVIATPEGKKKPCLFIRRGNQLVKVATINNNKDAETLDMYLKFLVDGETENAIEKKQ